jgi:hypothetical protein
MTTAIANPEISRNQRLNLTARLSAALRAAVAEANGNPEKTPKLAYDVMGNAEMRVKRLKGGQHFGNANLHFYVCGPKEPAGDEVTWGETHMAAHHTKLRLRVVSPEDIEMIGESGSVITPEALAAEVVASALAAAED